MSDIGKDLQDAYNKGYVEGKNQISDRKAMKITLKWLFELLGDSKGIYYTFKGENLEELIEELHESNVFVDGLIDYLKEHIDDFGENYGLI